MQMHFDHASRAFQKHYDRLNGKSFFVIESKHTFAVGVRCFIPLPKWGTDGLKGTYRRFSKGFFGETNIIFGADLRDALRHLLGVWRISDN